MKIRSFSADIRSFSGKAPEDKAQREIKNAVKTNVLKQRIFICRKVDSGQMFFKMVVGGGFEPPKAMLADLQSAPFSHSGIPPCLALIYCINRIFQPD